MSAAATTGAAPAAPVRTPEKAALAGWTGSALEHYDVAVHGAAALVLTHLFLPAATSPGTAIVLSVGTVGAGYALRPLGALVTGPLGDRLGRKCVLMPALFLMGGAPFAVGCLPTDDQARLPAPASRCR